MIDITKDPVIFFFPNLIFDALMAILLVWGLVMRKETDFVIVAMVIIQIFIDILLQIANCGMFPLKTIDLVSCCFWIRTKAHFPLVLLILVFTVDLAKVYSDAFRYSAYIILVLSVFNLFYSVYSDIKVEMIIDNEFC